MNICQIAAATEIEIIFNFQWFLPKPFWKDIRRKMTFSFFSFLTPLYSYTCNFYIVCLFLRTDYSLTFVHIAFFFVYNLFVVHVIIIIIINNIDQRLLFFFGSFFVGIICRHQLARNYTFFLFRMSLYVFFSLFPNSFLPIIVLAHHVESTRILSSKHILTSQIPSLSILLPLSQQKQLFFFHIEQIASSQTIIMAVRKATTCHFGKMGGLVCFLGGLHTSDWCKEVQLCTNMIFKSKSFVGLQKKEKRERTPSKFFLFPKECGSPFYVDEVGILWTFSSTQEGRWEVFSCLFSFGMPYLIVRKLRFTELQ